MNKLDQRWERLAAGTLGEAEHDELLGLADASGEAYQAYQAFKPLGPAFQKNMTAAILAQQRQEREAADAADAATRASAPLSAGRPPATGRKALLGSLGALLGTAMAALLVFPLTAPLDQFKAKQLAPIPPVRGEAPGQPASGRPLYTTGNVLTLEATAAAPQGAKLEARLYALGADGRLQLTEFPAAIDEQGSALSFGPLTVGRDLLLAPGVWKLLVVVARPGKFPEEAAILAAAAGGAPAARYWQVLVYHPIEIAPKRSYDELPEIR